MGSGGSSQVDQAETGKWNDIMPTTQEHTQSIDSDPEAHSALFKEIMESIEVVFAHFSQPDGFLAERLGDAMRVLGMNPTEEEVRKHLADLGGPQYIEERTFHHFIKDELIKHFEKAQVVVDYLKQYDKDGKGALSREELQEAMRGRECQELQASVAKVPSNSQGHLDIVELAKCFLELSDFQADKTSAEKCQLGKDTQAAEESVSGPALGEALKVNGSVTEIYLGCNHVGDEGVKALAEALKINASVTDIDLRCNQIGAEGAKALAEALKINKSATNIDLHRNQIDDEGAKALAEALKINKSATNIDLRRNQIDDEGAKALGEALKTNASVTNINLRDNKIGDEGAKALAEALKTNGSVTNITLDKNQIGDEGAKALTEAIEERNRKGVPLTCSWEEEEEW